MNKRNELIQTTNLVRTILELDPKARNSDSYLYFKVLCAHCIERNIDISNVPVTAFLLNMSEWGFPPFESVRRARQKIQHDIPELAGSKAVQAYRNENETAFREFARGEVG